ncbi:MAG TPA: hypothetical protein VF708_21475 [Pyrinomonadaceae bacterium]
MTRSSGKKRARTPPPNDAQVSPPLNPLRTGMPAPDSIIGVKQIKRGGKVYRIIKTNEMDAYDKPVRAKRKRSQ